MAELGENIMEMALKWLGQVKNNLFIDNKTFHRLTYLIHVKVIQESMCGPGGKVKTQGLKI